jgi:hypothetical protein
MAIRTAILMRTGHMAPGTATVKNQTKGKSSK